MSSTNSKSAPRAQRLHADLAVAELAVAAGLLLVAAVRLGGRRDRLAVGDPRRLQVHLDAEAALQLGDRDLDVELALAGEEQLLGLRIAAVADEGSSSSSRWIERADLVLVAAGLRLDGVGEHRLGELDGRERQSGSPLSPSVSPVSVSLSLATAPRSPAWSSGTCVWVFPCSTSGAPRRSGGVARLVVHGGIGLQGARHHAEHA